MNQDIPSSHVRELVVGFASIAVAFWHQIGRIGCVILLCLIGLRFYFVRELVAALALVMAICVPVFIVLLIFVLLHVICRNHLVLSPRVKSKVSSLLQGCRGVLHASNRKLVEGVCVATLIASAKLTFNRPWP
jgi:hypothetical protein